MNNHGNPPPGVGVEEPTPGIWGDNMGKKHDNQIRIATLNIGNMNQDPNAPKNRELLARIHETDIDVIGLQEIGLNWARIPSQHHFSRRIRQGLGISRGIASNLKTSNEQIFQPGGTAIITAGNISGRILDMTVDKSNMGRWAKFRMIGKGGREIHCWSVYRPTENKRGPTSTWNQQQTKLHEQRICLNPLTVWDNDLLDEITACIDSEHIPIVVGDFNCNVRQSNLATRLQQLGLKELITTTHHQLNSVETYNRNRSNTAIDGIWGPTGLDITAGGYCEFGDWPGDHRLVWLDIRNSELFGDSFTPTQQQMSRRLRLQDPRLVNRYLKQLEQIYRDTNLKERTLNLLQTCQRGIELTPAQAEEAEAIDQIRTEAMLYAEKKCRKFRFGHHPFSPTLQKSLERKEFWKLQVQRLEGKAVSRHKLQRLKRKLRITHPIPLSQDNALEQLRKARRSHKIAKDNAVDLRQSFLENLAEAQATQGNADRHTRLKQLLRNEDQRRVSGAIKYCLSEGASTKVLSVRIKRGEHYVCCSSKQDIEEACVSENIHRFNQTKGTFFMSRDMLNRVGYIAEKEGREQILKGQFRARRQVPVVVQEYISELQRATEDQDFIVITPEDNIKAWNSMKERTVSSPSGLHYGLWMANVRSEEANIIDTGMRNLSLLTGYCFKRWEYCIDAELLKTPGDWRVEKLRTIQMFEADFNVNNKALGRAVMKKAEQQNNLPPEHYGSRQHRSAPAAALAKKLAYDIMRQQKQAGILCSNDAKSCYDRITHSCAAISLERLGIHRSSIQAMCVALSRMNHAVRTGFGDSGFLYTNTDLNLQGIGQGNGAGPTIWVAVSTPILKLMRKKGFGFETVGPISGNKYKLVGVAFVDDKDTLQSKAGTTRDEMVEEFQEAMTTWEAGIRATGGALEPSKSFWYLIDFTFGRNGWEYVKAADASYDIQVRSLKGNDTEILAQLEPDEARRTLGVYLCPSGQQNTQTEVLVDKVTRWVARMRISRLNHADIGQAINTTIIKTLEYPLPVTEMSTKACGDIMRPLLRIMLSKAGLQRSYPRALLYGSNSLLGLQFPNLHCRQFAAHLREWCTGNINPAPEGHLMRISNEALCLEAGTYNSKFSFEWKTLAPAVTSTWITTLWKECEQYGYELRSNHDGFEPQRTNDQSLMEAAIHMGYRGKELLQINWVRLYLQVIHLSEITTMDGKEIERWAYNVAHRNKFTPYHWPNQPLPFTKSLKLWRHFLIRAFAVHENSLKLRQELGEWLIQVKKHQWWYNEEEDRIYEYDGQAWYGLGRLPTTRRRKTYVYIGGRSERAPYGCKPASVYKVGPSHWRLHSFTQNGTTPRKETPLPTWINNGIDTDDGGQEVANQLKIGTLCIATDGSQRNGIGTAGILLDAPTPVWCRCQIPGQRDEMSSTRAELGGVLAALLILEEICKIHKIKKGNVELGADNTAAWKSVNRQYAPDPRETDFDLKATIWTTIGRLPVKIRGRYVEGHQSAEAIKNDIWAARNDQCDKAAKSILNTCLAPLQTHEVICDEPWSIFCGHRKLTMVCPKKIQNEYFDERIKNYWRSAHRVQPCVFEEADLQSATIAASETKRQQRHFLSKFFSGNCGVNTTRTRWRQIDDESCARCGDSETPIHVIQCQGETTAEFWEKQWESLELWMRAKDTPEDWATEVLELLKSWQQGNIHESTLMPIRNQQRLGCEALWQGWCHRSWQLHLQAIFDERGTKQNGRRWCIELIKQLWRIAWDCWRARNKEQRAKRHREMQDESFDERIQEWFRRRHQLHPSLMFYFAVPVATLLQYTKVQQKQWIVNIERAVECYNEQEP